MLNLSQNAKKQSLHMGRILSPFVHPSVTLLDVYLAVFVPHFMLWMCKHMDVCIYLSISPEKLQQVRALA